MAIGFTAASSEYMRVDVAPVTSLPFTWACWFKTSDTSTRTLLFIGDKDTTQNMASLRVTYSGGSHYLNMGTYTSGSASFFTHSSSFTSGAWTHAAATFVGTTERNLFSDGTKVTNTSSWGPPASYDRFAVGYRGWSTPEQYFEGTLGEVGLWNAELSDEEIASLMHVTPLLVQPRSLVGYWPLYVWDDGFGLILGTDLGGGNHLSTSGGTPTKEVNPPLVYSASAVQCPRSRRAGISHPF